VATYGSVAFKGIPWKDDIMTAPVWSQTDLLRELNQVVEGELNRHIEQAKEWFPHDYIPWSEGRNFDGLMGGEPWSPEDAPVSDVARSALIVNLLTEDNLPSYHHEIALIFGRDDAWGDWVHRWTAEEGRHGIAMRDYMLVKRMVDPVALERFRMTHMSQGYESAHSGELVHSLAYVSFQELATRVSHRNTGRYTNDPLCDQLLARIAADENLHMVFYRNLLRAALALAPDQTMRAIRDVVKGFQMPGTDIPGFQRKAVEMAVAGIYDLRSHRDEVVSPILRFWKVWDVEGLGAEGEQARTELSNLMDDLDKQAARFEDKRDTLKARMKIG
jgi:acyl-[acyl-carrier-protein] desaturase